MTRQSTARRGGHRLELMGSIFARDFALARGCVVSRFAMSTTRAPYFRPPGGYRSDMYSGCESRTSQAVSRSLDTRLQLQKLHYTRKEKVVTDTQPSYQMFRVTFGRTLGAFVMPTQVLTLTESTDWLYAWGGSNVFVTHTVDGSFSLSLTSCEIGDAGGGASKKEYAHAW